MLLFRIVGGEIVPEINMEPWQTIFDLKSKIKEKVGVPIHRQHLWFQCSELRNDHIIAEYGFRRNETFHLMVEPLPLDLKLHVLIKTFNNGYVRVRETDRVSELRRKVAKYWALPYEGFTLTRFNVEMKDDRRLIEYYINEDSEVKCSVKMEPR